MFTTKLTNQFTASLLNAVSGVLNEAKKCEDCDCAKCECDDAEEVDESASLSDTLKRERAGKEKKEPNGVKTEEVQDLDETAKIVAHLSKRYGDNIRKSHVMSAAKDFGVDASKLAKAVRTKLGKNMLDEKHDDVPFEGPYDKPGVRKDKYGNVIKNVAKHLAKKAMNAQKNEEVEELEEKRGLWDNIHAKRKRIKAGSSERMRKPGSEGAPSAADLKASQTEEVEIDEVAPPGAKYERMVKHIKKAYAKDGKLTGKEKGIAYATAWKAKNEEASQTDEAFEQIDELSKGTMGRYVNKAADRMSTQGVTAGLKIAADEKSKKNFDTIAKRQKGIATAVSKLTKEEQDFIDALNDVDMEQIDELSVKTLDQYRSKARKDIIDTDDNNDNRINKRAKGYMDASKQVQKKLAKEEVELDEARGRPRKAGAKEFTINPKTKEKLMHDNPEHMKKIEALQRNGVIPVPKTEAGQHVVNQLTKAKLSMRGGETINFTHGEPHHVSGDHAAKLLTKYAGMKPDEKEAFQKKIGHSHASLKSEL